MTTRADDNSDDTTAVRAPDYVDPNYLFPQVKAYDPELLISGSGVRNPDGALVKTPGRQRFSAFQSVAGRVTFVTSITKILHKSSTLRRDLRHSKWLVGASAGSGQGHR